MFLTCEHLGEEVLDYYASLLPSGQRTDAMARVRIAIGTTTEHAAELCAAVRSAVYATVRTPSGIA